jgi:uncharacterized membrane protein YebE (DUF533 family)
MMPTPPVVNKRRTAGSTRPAASGQPREAVDKLRRAAREARFVTAPAGVIPPHAGKEQDVFDPERLLGQMLGGTLGDAFGGHRGRGRGRSLFATGSLGGKAQIGMGLLGLAIAAWEHHGARQQPAAQSSTSSPSGATTPPPPPPPASAMPPPPPPSPASGTATTRAMPLLDERQQAVVLLIRAMIAAANADGHIDAQERASILSRARDGGLDDDSLHFLEAEIARPRTLEQIVGNTPPALASETYAAAALAISIDTDAERAWLDALAQGLRLDPGVRADIDARVAA